MTAMRVLTVAVLLAASSVAFAASGQVAPQGSVLEVSSTPILLYPSRPDDKRAGSLIYRGGLELSAGDVIFGGWSDLAVSADGGEILVISDGGRWLRARLGYDSNGDLAKLESARYAPMQDLNGRRARRDRGDAEGMTLERPNDLYGPVLVSSEHDPHVWRYDVTQSLRVPATNVPIGAWAKVLPDNQQLEAITLWKPDTLLMFAETQLAGGDIPAAMQSYPGANGQTTMRLLSVVPHQPFAITGVANAPDGGLYLLERRFTILGGLGAQIRHIPADSIREGARLDGKVLANLSFQDANIDNMEGIAVRRGPRGETLLYIISDNNFRSLQRNLLLMFEVR